MGVDEQRLTRGTRDVLKAVCMGAWYRGVVGAGRAREAQFGDAHVAVQDDDER